ncbi:energy transducer TonB [Sphingomonas sp. 1P06PA]|uniref:energy transducer TonB n=1 Tax=Sphingomonas sp. 1P06PA TaxID=554121 RepID=UPI0039A6D543
MDTLTSDDYPKDLLRRDVSGLTSIELTVSATGKIKGTRIIASQPSGLFDAVAAAKLASVSLLPAQRNNTAAPCRGMVQNVRW